MANPVELLRQQGQSIWLDFLRRGLVTSGELERMVRECGATGAGIPEGAHRTGAGIPEGTRRA